VVPAFFSLALYLVKGAAGFREYTQDNLLADKEILDLSRRVTLDVDPEIEAEYQRTHPRGARVTVRLRSGEEFVEQVGNLPEMTPEEIDDKFRDIATVVLPADRTEALLHRVRHIDEVRNVAELAPMFVP
jgi:2-methylcitrate dehydratase PrpD